MHNRRAVLTQTALAALAGTSLPLSQSARAQGRKETLVMAMALEPTELDPTASAA